MIEGCPIGPTAHEFAKNLTHYLGCQEMSLYAWKVVIPARPPHENIGTLNEVEACLDASGLPGASTAKLIVERTRLMQSEGQGYYKEPTNGEGWSLLWVAQYRRVGACRQIDWLVPSGFVDAAAFTRRTIMTAELEQRVWDCAVIGGGPAGLTAAVYLARYHLSVTVFDDRTSRAAMIPISHNHAGFPDGINGAELLSRMRAQAQRYGALVQASKVMTLDRENDLFMFRFESGVVLSRTVLMATGVVNRRPPMLPDKHDDAVARGLLRYCPVCDGFEVSDKPVGVFGKGTKGFKEAKFLRSFTRDLTLVAPDEVHDLSDDKQRDLEGLGIKVEGDQWYQSNQVPI